MSFVLEKKGGFALAADRTRKKAPIIADRSFERGLPI